MTSDNHAASFLANHLPAATRAMPPPIIKNGKKSVAFGARGLDPPNSTSPANRPHMPNQKLMNTFTTGNIVNCPMSTVSSPPHFEVTYEERFEGIAHHRNNALQANDFLRHLSNSCRFP
jgi:hypothetical protein